MLSSQGWASDFGSFTSKFSWYAGSKDIPVVVRCDSAVTSFEFGHSDLRVSGAISYKRNKYGLGSDGSRISLSHSWDW